MAALGSGTNSRSSLKTAPTKRCSWAMSGHSRLNNRRGKTRSDGPEIRSPPHFIPCFRRPCQARAPKGHLTSLKPSIVIRGCRSLQIFLWRAKVVSRLRFLLGISVDCSSYTPLNRVEPNRGFSVRLSFRGWYWHLHRIARRVHAGILWSGRTSLLSTEDQQSLP